MRCVQQLGVRTVRIVTSEQAAAIDSLDVTADAAALGTSEANVRQMIREAVAAGLLVVEAVTSEQVILRGTFPDEQQREDES